MLSVPKSVEVAREENLPLLILDLPTQHRRVEFREALSLGSFPYFREINEIPPEGTRFAFPIRVFVTASNVDNLWKHLSEIPAEVLARIQEGSAVLLLDSSGEGRQIKDHDPEELHRWLEKHRIPVRSVVLLTQNRLLQAQYDEWLSGKGLREGVGISIVHSYLWMLLNATEVEPGFADCEERKTWIESNEFLGRPRGKKFLCLNYTPRDHRILMMLYILKNELLDEGYNSFPGVSGPKLLRQMEAVKLKPLHRQPEGLLTALPEMIERCPLILDHPLDGKTMPSGSVADARYYRDSYFSMVTETEVNSANRRRFTEKLFKPVLAGHPFLVLGLARTLEDFRALGFRTFSPWISEEYDQILDTKDRIAAVFSEFSRLCAFTPEQWSVLMGQLRETILHNHIWFRRHLRQILEKEQLAPLQKELETRTASVK